MKTGLLDAHPDAAPIVQLTAETPDAAAEMRLLELARVFSEPLLRGRTLDSGENALAHADAVASILHGIGAAPSLRAAVYLAYAADQLDKPEEQIAQKFGASQASLVANTRKLVQIQRAARAAQVGHDQRGQQLERVRKMLLAFSRDLRVVLLRLASRLQTLRFFAANKLPCAPELASESMQVFAPLANRLGIWQIKWELEDLAFRFLEPAQYLNVAQLLDERRVQREQGVEALRGRLADDLAARGVHAEVQGRPKHIYSIWKKMQGKGLGFAQVLDLRAMRVIVTDVAACYVVLGRVHELYRAVAGELDDYIVRPKPNGYQSLHTVVLDDADRPVEVQIRTEAMHQHAEHGVAAHWAYKDAGTKGYGGVSADAAQQSRIAEARKAVLRQLLAWERETAEHGEQTNAKAGAAADERIYVFTPAAAVVELPAGATPIDFAYTVHTDVGHRCRGAKVDGAMVPLNTALHSGQTVEVNSIKEGGPSLDWLNAELGYLKSARARTKVRAWFNALAQKETTARGRDAVEKLLQREGRTAIKLDDLASRLGFRHADALFEVVGKDEFSLRNIENLFRPAEPPASAEESIALRRSQAAPPKGAVLVVGVDSLLTTLARCCRPAPPDSIKGYVTRGKGVAVHRTTCANFRQMSGQTPERVLPVAWAVQHGERTAMYPVEVLVEAVDRQGLLRDVSEAFAKEKMNVTGVRTQSTKDAGGGTARMIFTVEVTDSQRLAQFLGVVAQIGGVRAVRRR
ncbi:MAG: bifunctional (p)ppGpp synthetase/guanosine-3',5'-bis(diphosphate) 3'-pyrophosphohydrolase [Burkholderiaceae bacterium]